MKLGVWLPAVAAHPRFPTPDWERTAGAGELAMIALAADELGYDCVCAPEHVALPVGRGEGTQYWDPLTTLGYLAAKTRRIRLAPLVVVLGYHHPLEIVKRYGTLDLISGGRVVLGVGVGGTEGEFALLGASFRDRGKRADDSIAAIRASLGLTMPAYEGTWRARCAPAARASASSSWPMPCRPVSACPTGWCQGTGSYRSAGSSGSSRPRGTGGSSTSSCSARASPPRAPGRR